MMVHIPRTRFLYTGLTLCIFICRASNTNLYSIWLKFEKREKEKVRLMMVVKLYVWCYIKQKKCIPLDAIPLYHAVCVPLSVAHILQKWSFVIGCCITNTHILRKVHKYTIVKWKIFEHEREFLLLASVLHKSDVTLCKKANAFSNIMCVHPYIVCAIGGILYLIHKTVVSSITFFHWIIYVFQRLYLCANDCCLNLVPRGIKIVLLLRGNCSYARGEKNQQKPSCSILLSTKSEDVRRI